MKRNLLNFLAVASLAATTVLAQGPPAGHDRGTPPDPATMVAHQVERLTRLLTLTDAQQAQATTIFTNAATASTAIRTNLQTAQASLKTAVQKNDAASIDNLSAQIGSLTGQEVNVQSKAQAAFYKILTADQQAKYTSTRGGFGGMAGGFDGPQGMRRGFAGGRFGGPRQ